MRHALAPGATLGYCTNVHAGATIEQMRAQLQQHAVAVRQRICPDQPMGVGLWFSDESARTLLTQHGVADFREWLDSCGFLPYTLNGFPFGDFHQKVVKHDVYRPDWRGDSRLRYTENLARILAGLLPDDAAEGSISTLPLGWPDEFSTQSDRDAAHRQLIKLAGFLYRLEQESGKYIHVNLEPEPGCVLDTAEDVVTFFKSLRLAAGADEPHVRRYLGVCHDVCHSAVMFEPQAHALTAYRAAGIHVGKVQLSSAVRMPQACDAALRQLAAFCEERYLHQTTLKAPDGGFAFYDDLPHALEDLENTPSGAEWRVHFHVPVYLETFDHLTTTREQLLECLDAIKPEDQTHHFEVETYAWSVLPSPLQTATLAEGIANELAWVRDAVKQTHGNATQ